MNMDFLYQKHVDLVFHILAHIKVDNPSDLFSEPYIEKMSLAIQDDPIFLPQSAVTYYNQNFDRLGIINFLPFFAQSMEELVPLLRDYHRFNEDDQSLFVYPFVDALTKHSTKYFEFWDKQFDKEKANRLLIEEALRSKINQYGFLFDYYKKSAKAWLSFSITKNGRGIQGISDCFSAAVPYPLSIDKLDNTFFMLLHEYTHQFTDAMINADIHMDDGSHDLSENIVILTDYYLIKSICPTDVAPYVSWLAPKGEETNSDEDLFLNIFKVPEHMQQRMDKVVDQLLGSWKW
ncbi:MAG TPA: hypothetical protein H9674_02375 [Firmicutes bacterium]|nr:hypothetical protein [Bacillota bacterium]